MKKVALAFAAGIAGGIAMVPLGLFLKRVLGYSLNVYGELLVKMTFGRVVPWAIVTEHFLISWGMALPLLLLLTVTRFRNPLWLGALYGAALWLLVNSLLLPAAFGRASPWGLGWNAIWPSLSIHVVYGVTAAAVLRWKIPSADSRP